jgi:uncharacterized glyoxalase superfamily protein PhnB
MKTQNRRTSNEDTVEAVPHGYHTVTPYLIVKNAQGFLDFIVEALNGKVESKMNLPDGTIGHSSVRIGDSVLMVGEQMRDMPATSVMLYLYVEDVDKLFAHASKSKSATVLQEPRDEFYGDRAGCFSDEWGNKWWISTHVEDVSESELQRRQEQMKNN